MLYRLEFWKLRFLKLFNISLGNKIKLAGFTVHFADIEHLTLLYKEIFIKHNYKFDFSKSPYIIDGGANIGLAVLYFKRFYPDSKIVAFEPNPESFEYLKKNVESNNLQNVELHNAALGSESGNILFYTSTDMPSADIGASAIRQHVDFHHSHKGKIIEVSVPCLQLSSFINKTVNLLKLDVEGSESRIIREVNENFSMVENSIMEFHYHIDNPDNSLADILKVMENNHHIYFLSAIGKSTEVRKASGYVLKSKKVNLAD